MKEITKKNNTMGLRVFINGVPNLKLIPKDEAVDSLTKGVADIIEALKKRGILIHRQLDNNPYSIIYQNCGFARVSIPLTYFRCT